MTNIFNLTHFRSILFHHICSFLFITVVCFCLIAQEQVSPTNITDQSPELSPATESQADPTSTLSEATNIDTPDSMSDVNTDPSSVDAEEDSVSTKAQANPASTLSNTVNTDTPGSMSDVNIDPSSVDAEEDSTINETIDAPIDELNEQVNVPLNSIDESFDLQSYEYDPLNKKDPFLSLRVEKKITTKGEINTGVMDHLALEPLLPLERFSIDQLKLIGIIWGGNEPRVLVMDPNNKSYVVRKNERIGRNKGYLADIREGEVIIAEPHQYGSKIQYSIRTLSLQKNKK